jgi:hypothetical protein
LHLKQKMQFLNQKLPIQVTIHLMNHYQIILPIVKKLVKKIKEKEKHCRHEEFGMNVGRNNGVLMFKKKNVNYEQKLNIVMI